MIDESILDEMDLPLSNPNEDLETISKTLLWPLFDATKFTIRSEDFRDKGIDLHIELKTPTQHTNFRLAIQLKATENKKPNSDGTVSLQVYRSNINYLLNNPGPAYYVLYFKNTNTFYYENLNDFVKILSEKDIDWQEQDTHVIRFSKVLTEEAITDIYKETLQKGIFHRVVNQKLIQHSSSIHSGDKVLIDSNLDISDDSEIRELIERGGFVLINEGRGKDIMALHKKGSQAISSTAKYNLILGISNYYNGNLVNALSFLKSAQRLKSELSSELANHMEFFLISVKHSLGLYTDTDYNKRMNELEDADTLGLYIKIDKAKIEYYRNLTDSEDDKFEKLIADIQSILNHPKSDKGVKFYAKSELVLIQGAKNNWDYVKSIVFINAAESNIGPDIAMRLDCLKKFSDSKASWYNDVQLLKGDILKERNRFYYFTTILNEVKVIFEMTVFTREVTFEKDVPGMSVPIAQDLQPLFTALFEKLDLALKFYRLIGHIENEVVVLSTRYELEHYLGDYARAAETISEVENLIDLYELTDKRRRLTHLKNKGTTHESFSIWSKGIIETAEVEKKEMESIINEIKKMDEEEKKDHPPKIEYLHIHLFPLGHFRFPENNVEKVYEILQIKDAKVKRQFDQLFTFVIPLANIYYPEITQEGPLEGNLADRGLVSWKNIYRVRKAFYENKFYRDVSIP